MNHIDRAYGVVARPLDEDRRSVAGMQSLTRRSKLASFRYHTQKTSAATEVASVPAHQHRRSSHQESGEQVFASSIAQVKKQELQKTHVETCVKLHLKFKSRFHTSSK